MSKRYEVITSGGALHYYSIKSVVETALRLSGSEITKMRRNGTFGVELDDSDVEMLEVLGAKVREVR